MYWNVKNKVNRAAHTHTHTHTHKYILMPSLWSFSLQWSRRLTLFIHASIIKPLFCSARQIKLFIVCNMPLLKFILRSQLPRSSLVNINTLTWAQIWWLWVFWRPPAVQQLVRAEQSSGVGKSASSAPGMRDYPGLFGCSQTGEEPG